MRKFWLILLGLAQVAAVVAIFLYLKSRHAPQPPAPPIAGPTAPIIPEVTTIHEVPAIMLPAPEGQPPIPAPAHEEPPPKGNAIVTPSAVEIPQVPPAPPTPGGAPAIAAPPADARPSVAVLPLTFVNTSSNKPLATALGEQYAGRLEDNVDLDRFRVFDREHVQELLKESSLANSDLADNEGRAAAVLRLKNVQQLVVGRAYVYLNNDNKLVLSEIQARRLDCRTGEVLARGSTTSVEEAQLPAAFVDMAVQMGLHAGVAPPIPQSDARAEGGLMTQVNLDQPFHVQLRTLDGKAVYDEGDQVTFEVRSDADCYVTLVSKDPAGEITMLLPNRWANSNEALLVKKGEPRVVPWAGCGFKFPIQPPHGKMLVRAIASRKAPIKIAGVDVDSLKSAGFLSLNKDDRGNPKSIGVVADPPPTDTAVQARTNSLEGQLNALPPDQWTTAELVLTTRGANMAQAPTPSPAPVQPPPAATMPAPASTPPPAASDTASAHSPANPQPAASAGPVDPNDQLLDRWKKLSGAQTTSFSLHVQSLRLTGAKGLGGDDDPPAPSELLIFRHPLQVGAKSVNADRTAGSVMGDMQVEPMHGGGIKGLGLDDLSTRIAAIKNADPTVVAVVPNIALRSFALPPTKLIGVQWALHNDINGGNDTGWDRAAAEIMRIKTPLIGVCDQGLNLSDPRLAALVWTNTREIPGNGVDDDGNGLIDDIHGYNFVLNSPVLFDPRDDYNHGSMCASIIAGRSTGDARDVIGIAPQAQIIPAVVMSVDPGKAGAGPHGDLKSILRGLDYCAASGARVINLSLGGSVDQKAYDEINKLPIWDELEKRGVVLVCAAGNDYADNDKNLVFPASLKRSNIITVMAVDPAGKLARYLDDKGKWTPFSNFGATSVHLGAPGSLILGAPASNQARLDFGTSFSAPMVTGAVALIMGKHPDWDHRKVIDAVLKTVHACDDLQGKCVTGGTLDISAALGWNP